MSFRRGTKKAEETKFRQFFAEIKQALKDRRPFDLCISKTEGFHLPVL
jgi:hypothetical protein